MPVIVDFLSSRGRRSPAGTRAGRGAARGSRRRTPRRTRGRRSGTRTRWTCWGARRIRPGTILGETVGPTATYIRLTQAGDANLDGVVNFDDLLRLAKSYGKSSLWYGGDFNYDGVTNFDDLLILAKNYGGAQPGRRWTIDSPAPGFAGDVAAAFGQAAVPEPGVVGGAVLVGGLAVVRRGRQHGAAVSDPV